MQFTAGGKAPPWLLSRNMLLLMRMTAVFLLAAVLQVCTPGLSRKVSISGKDLSLEQVFAEIKKQTGFEFIYSSSILKNARRVTLDIRNRPVEEVLKFCLQGQGVGFKIRSGTIIIFRQ